MITTLHRSVDGSARTVIVWAIIIPILALIMLVFGWVAAREVRDKH